MTVMRDRYCWITAQTDGTEHAVSDDAQVAACRGIFEALCGERFLAAPMEVGPAGQCACCGMYLRARAAVRDASQRLAPPRRSWFTRLRCHGRGRHAA